MEIKVDNVVVGAVDDAVGVKIMEYITGLQAENARLLEVYDIAADYVLNYGYSGKLDRNRRIDLSDAIGKVQALQGGEKDG